MSDTRSIGDSSFHADDGPSSGISLRAWLIGQAITGAVSSGLNTTATAVNEAFDIADAVIARLDREHAQREATRLEQQRLREAEEDARRKLEATWGGPTP